MIGIICVTGIARVGKDTIMRNTAKVINDKFKAENKLVFYEIIDTSAIAKKVFSEYICNNTEKDSMYRNSLVEFINIQEMYDVRFPQIIAEMLETLNGTSGLSPNGSRNTFFFVNVREPSAIARYYEFTKVMGWTFTELVIESNNKDSGSNTVVDRTDIDYFKNSLNAGIDESNIMILHNDFDKADADYTCMLADVCEEAAKFILSQKPELDWYSAYVNDTEE